MKAQTNPRFRDLAGQRFGRLIAREPTDKRADQGSIVWLCECDCGNTAEVSSRRLVRGQVRSCGCLSSPEIKDYIGRHFGRLEVIAYAGKVRKNKSTVTYWKCRCECGNEVVIGQTELQNGDTQSCGCLQRDKAKEALKMVDDTSVSILERVKDAPRKNNKSGYTGVFQTKDGRWMAYISFRKKRYYLGRYQDIEDAVKARKRGEEMHDEFLEWYYREYPKQKKESMDRKTRRKKMNLLRVSTAD